MDGGADDFKGRALQTADTFSCYISLEVKFGCHSRPPGGVESLLVLRELVDESHTQ